MTRREALVDRAGRNRPHDVCVGVSNRSLVKAAQIGQMYAVQLAGNLWSYQRTVETVATILCVCYFF